MASEVDRRWLATAPERIEADLAALWSEVSRAAPVTRAVMANLVIVCAAAADRPVDLQAEADCLPSEEVSRRHPCRVIVLQQAPSTGGGGAVLGAAVGVLAFGPSHARYGVEHIAVRSGCAGESLPSIVRSLALGDVPTTVWWMDDVCDRPPFADLMSMARQIVYDSRTWRDVRAGALAVSTILGQPHRPDLADLNWRRLLPLRRALVATLEAAHAAAALPALEVHHRPGDSALAWLLVGWLSARGVISMPSDRIGVREGAGGDTIAVSVPGTRIAASMNDVRAVASHDDGAPLVVAVPRESAADAVAAELRNLHHDVCLHDAVLALSHFPAGAFSR